jgi:hypothetical protein
MTSPAPHACMRVSSQPEKAIAMPRKPKPKNTDVHATPEGTPTETTPTYRGSVPHVPTMPDAAATAKLTDATAQTQAAADAMAEEHPGASTGTQRALVRSTVVMPSITLPSIPAVKASDSQPRVPVVLSPLGLKPDNKTLSKHPTNPVVVIPAVQHQDTIPMAVPPRPMPKARARTHRMTLATVLVLALGLLVIFVPVARGAGLGVPNWVPLADARAYPTPTPSPTPIYAVHPVVFGVHDFICTALPFARLVQVKQKQNGLPHPWYVSVIIAQWGVEHGWHIPDYTGYNWGNSSAIPGFDSVGGLNVPGSPGAFAYAHTPLEGVSIYEIFTRMHFYTAVYQNYPNGPVAQAEALGQSPWDAGHYQEGGGIPGQSILNAMNGYNLYRFDNPSVFC